MIEFMSFPPSQDDIFIGVKGLGESVTDIDSQKVVSVHERPSSFLVLPPELSCPHLMGTLMGHGIRRNPPFQRISPSDGDIR